MRTFGVTSRKKIADLSPPAQPMKTCKFPAAYGLIYQLPQIRLSGLPQTDTEDAPYNGNTLVPPKRQGAHLDRVDPNPTCLHYRAAAAAIDSIAFIKSLIENPAVAHTLIMTRCPLLAAKDPSVKQCVQPLLITLECVNTAADRSCRAKVAYHQRLSDLLGPADSEAVQRDKAAGEDALFTVLAKDGIVTDIIYDIDYAYIVLPGALSADVGAQIKLGVTVEMRKELGLLQMTSGTRVTATLLRKEHYPPRQLALMMTATELATLALHDFLLRVGDRTSSLLVHGSHGGTIPEHASAFVLVGDTLGRASLDEAIQLQDWMVDGALAAMTAPQPQDWSDEYYMNVSHSIVGICKTSATIPSTAGSTSWRFAFCAHTPGVVIITVEERALAEALDVAFACHGSRLLMHAYCARGGTRAITEFDVLEKPFVTPPMTKFMANADLLLDLEEAPIEYGTTCYIPFATQLDLLSSGTFPFPGGHGRQLFSNTATPPTWAQQQYNDGEAAARLMLTRTSYRTGRLCLVQGGPTTAREPGIRVISTLGSSRARGRGRRTWQGAGVESSSGRHGKLCHLLTVLQRYPLKLKRNEG